MKKSLFIISSILMMFPLIACDRSVNEAIDASYNYIDVLFNCDQGYSFDNGLRTKYVHIRKNAKWVSVKNTAPSKINDDYKGFSYDIPTSQNFWTLDNTLPVVISDDYSFTKTTNIYAHIVPTTDIKITVNPGNGTWRNKKSGETTGKEPRVLPCKKDTYWGNISNNFLVTPPGQQLFLGFTYQSGSETITIKDSDKITSNYVLTAQYVDTPSYSDFATDSWDMFVIAANQGLTYLKTVYSKESFLGLTRKVTLYGVDYEVRVIGEEQDSKSDTTDKAALTFEFVDAIETGIGYGSSSNSYENSAIRNYLNSNFYNSLPDALRSNIKTVDKKTFETEIGTPQVKTYKDKVFLPSFVELGIKEFDCGVKVECQPEGFGADGKDPYKYYVNSTELMRKKYYTENPLNPQTKNRYEVEYWLRSPDYDGNDSAYYIEKDGKTPSEGPYYCDIGLSISPCFCI